MRLSSIRAQLCDVVEQVFSKRVAVCILYHQSKQTALKARASAPAKPLIASALDSHQDAKVLATASCCQSNGPSGRDTCCSASGKALALSSAALTACACQSTHDPASAHTLPEIIAMYYQQPLKVFYGTQTGTAKLFANQLGETLKAQNLPATVLDVADYDTEDFFTEKSVCLFLLATYNVENPTDWLLKWLEDTRYDHRVAKGSLSHLRYAVFGLGDSAYSDEFGFAGRAADKGFGTLGARRMYPLGEGDKNEDQL
ncbi:Fe-S oxidoreductase, partial [Dimargaris verticillata]